MAVPTMHQRQGRGGLHPLVYVLLTSTFALTSTPVCGSVFDLNPVNCCAQHACGKAAVAPGRAEHSQEPQCAGHSRNLGVSGNDAGAARCCEFGRLNYPGVRVKSVVSATRVLPIVAVIAVYALTPAAAFSQPVDWWTPLKVPLIPLYLLTATYRI
jgi:hypothetical protein